MYDIIVKNKQKGSKKNMKIYQIIRNLREDNDYKQSDIAKILEIKQQQYSVYENGKQEFPTRHIKTLCLFYGVSADYILGLPDNLKYPKS